MFRKFLTYLLLVALSFSTFEEFLKEYFDNLEEISKSLLPEDTEDEETKKEEMKDKLIQKKNENLTYYQEISLKLNSFIFKDVFFYASIYRSITSPPPDFRY